MKRNNREEEERQLEKEQMIREKNEEKKKLEIERERKDINRWKESLVEINNDEFESDCMYIFYLKLINLKYKNR